MLERPGYVPLTLRLKEGEPLVYPRQHSAGRLPRLAVGRPFYGGMYNIEPATVQPVINRVGARAADPRADVAVGAARYWAVGFTIAPVEALCFSRY